MSYYIITQYHQPQNKFITKFEVNNVCFSVIMVPTNFWQQYNVINPDRWQPLRDFVVNSLWTSSIMSSQKHHHQRSFQMCQWLPISWSPMFLVCDCNHYVFIFLIFDPSFLWTICSYCQHYKYIHTLFLIFCPAHKGHFLWKIPTSHGLIILMSKMIIKLISCIAQFFPWFNEILNSKQASFIGLSTTFI